VTAECLSEPTDSAEEAKILAIEVPRPICKQFATFHLVTPEVGAHTPQDTALNRDELTLLSF
jgi:hypothetical protein